MRFVFRVVCALLLAGLVSAGVVLAVPVPASAGGSTSVLLSSPSLEKTASLHVSQPEYAALGELLERSAGAAEPVDWDSPAGLVTVTWLAHDVSVWQVHQLHLMPRGGVVISRGESAGGNLTWYRSGAATELLRLLDKLGVATLDDRTRAATGGTAAAEPPGAADSREPDTDALTPTAGNPRDSRLWGLYGLIAGVLLTLAVTRLRRRLPNHTP